jgi:hypothetical protein
MGSSQQLGRSGLKLGDGIGDFMRFTSDAPTEATRAGKDQPGASVDLGLIGSGENASEPGTIENRRGRSG